MDPRPARLSHFEMNGKKLTGGGILRKHKLRSYWPVGTKLIFGGCKWSELVWGSGTAKILTSFPRLGSLNYTSELAANDLCSRDTQGCCNNRLVVGVHGWIYLNFKGQFFRLYLMLRCKLPIFTRISTCSKIWGCGQIRSNLLILDLKECQDWWMIILLSLQRVQYV